MLAQFDPLIRARLRRIIRVAVIVIVVWVLATVVLVVLARQRVNAGLDTLQHARGKLTADALLRGDALGALQQAQRDFASAHSLVGNLGLAPWSLVPLAGGNVTSTRDLTAAAERVAKVGARAAKDGAAALRVHPNGAAARLALLDQVAAIAGRAQHDLDRINLGPDFFLIGPLGNARARFLDRIHRLRDAVSNAQALVTGAARVLRGPRRYLVLAANNGEMRSGSGMFLSAGVATFSGGTFTISGVGPSAFHDLPPGAVPVPAALAGLWGWVGPSQHFRNLGTDPRFDVTAALAAQMWAASTGQSVDGVLGVDADALAALLRAQGPIQVGGQALSGGNVADYLLLGQYTGVPAQPASEQDRRDQLSAIAQGSVETLSGRAWNSAALISALTQAGKGRHVLAWSRDPAEQLAWEAAGISGELHHDSIALSALNFGGNKLDQFLHVDATLSIRSRADGANDASLTVRIHNTAPTDLAGYVAGPYPGSGVGEGVYQGVLALNVPEFASVPVWSGAGATVAAGIDGPTRTAAAGYFRVPRGQTIVATATFRLAAGAHSMRLEPSARIPVTKWRYRGLKVTDAAVEHFQW